ncbi:MAG: acetylxylan esterase, partial [Planctomycetes bacterium]|nr:acetylxylan esterase [Planctomycetota bacterium]
MAGKAGGAGVLWMSLWCGALLQSSFGEEPAPKATAPEPVVFTTQQDHQHMLRQLGITKLRPGPSGNEKDPNHANYDEALANPFPQLPDVLTLKSGEKVTTAEDWWNKRRPEIVEDFEREVYGRIPANVPRVEWEVTETRELSIGDVPVVMKQLVGKADNSACPAIEVKIGMTLMTPQAAEQPVPVLMMFGFGFPGGGRGGRGGANPPGPPGRGFGPPGPTPGETLLKAGWGFAILATPSIQADNGQGLTR